ncbi:phospholipid carrier-dependent glycosyltransferase [Trichlorobacter lovleyi]|uniref:Glycosyl transferase family 39 n=1 Tax=Trichlorobacter lovleyi (strain ATCC BAA-1151 / DSM 17278 / SZ) TaxID=398767 RepID=B3EAU4_TRIL1|nr:phospholipid carrier-dependent glycosyltransferase [Trichlorobacter lovleyi]ACD96977.1 glycosyl transferase family 39 [Trichlorobacter lovleyi SZ]
MSPLYEHLNQPEGHWLRDSMLLLILFGFLFLAGLGSAPLIDPDEGRYAEIPREMLVRGDFVTPTLNYVKYFEKPPLLYWVNAGSMALFGQNEFAARLPSALSGLFTVLLTYLAGRRLFSRRIALIGALILGSCAAFLLQSRIILTDMLLTLCLSAALFSFLLAVRSSLRHRTNLYRLFFICCGLAVLTKGLIGIVLPGGIIFWYLLLSRRWHLLKEIPWFSGMLLFSLVTVPWFLLVSQANPEFPHFFFIREHFQRYTSTIHRRSQPFWFFLPILLLTMLPWSFFLPGSFTKAWQQRHNNRGTTLFLLLWPLVIILFFSLSSSKLIPYILPTFPPLALLLAHRITAHWHTRRPDYTTAQATLAALLLLLGAALAILPLLTWLPPLLHASGQTGRDLAAMLSGPAPVLTLRQTLLPGSLLVIFGLLLLWSIRTRSTLLLIGLLCCFGILLDLLLPWAFTRYGAERLSSRSLAKAALQQSGPDTVLAQSGPRQGMNFYTGKRLITVGDADELTFGSSQGNQSGWFLSQEQFMELWRSNRQVMIVIPRHEASRYDAAPSGPSPRTLADNGALLLLSNR